MSYRINFRDKTSVLVDNVQGDKLKELFLANDDPQMPLDIHGENYRLYDLLSIRRASSQDDRLPIISVDRLIAQGKECKGQYSIQKEINRLIKDEHPEDWGKVIRDRRAREKYRTDLRGEKGVLWCDYKAKECACD